VEFLLPLLLDGTLRVVVLGIGRPPLPLHPALQPTNLLLVKSQGAFALGLL
jgi:hypothetical protein